MDLNTFKEYVRLHLISLEQDSEFLEKRLDEVTNYDSDEYEELEITDIGNNGEIRATAHLLQILEEVE
jgi:hypothetical protein